MNDTSLDSYSVMSRVKGQSISDKADKGWYWFNKIPEQCYNCHNLIVNEDYYISSNDKFFIKGYIPDIFFICDAVMIKLARSNNLNANLTIQNTEIINANGLITPSSLALCKLLNLMQYGLYK